MPRGDLGHQLRPSGRGDAGRQFSSTGRGDPARQFLASDRKARIAAAGATYRRQLGIAHQRSPGKGTLRDNTGRRYLSSALTLRSPSRAGH
jgi:hypothetical protein